MSRKLKLLSDNISMLLKKQIVHELENELLYKSFANYFELEGISKLSAYYLVRSQEEHTHAMWIYDYLTQADCRIIYPEVPLLGVQKVSNWLEPFDKTIDKEIETTQLIYAIYKAAFEEGDYMTTTWLQKLLIPEQIEEENTSRMAKTIMECDSDVLLKAEEIYKLLK